MSMQVELFRQPPRIWDAFVTQHGAATMAHSYGWKSVIEETYGHECYYLAATRRTVIAGVLPLVKVQSGPFGKFLVSMPYLNQGGPIGSPEAIQALVQAARSLARDESAEVLELRCTQSLDLDLPAYNGKIACILDLDERSGAVWDRFPAKLRSQIRRAQKAGCEVRFGEDQLDPFFSVFARNMRDLGSPTHSRDFFRSIAKLFGESAWFGCVYHQARPVAGACAIRFGNEVEITWASSLREFNSLAPNMHLYWSFIERAADCGSARFNFGRCTPDSGSHRFKQQWGPRDVSLYWHGWQRDGAQLPGESSRSLALAARMWRHVPVPIATWLGPYLRRGIPA